MAAALAVVLTLWPAAPAQASTDGGASSRVVGRGDIITSILGLTPSRQSRASSPGRPPRCRWATLDDATIERLVAMLAERLGRGLEQPLIGPLAPYLDDGELPDGDLAMQACDDMVTGLRFTPREGPTDTTEVLLRRMITRLPVPEPTMSPPPGSVVPLRHPVFVSVPEAQWQPVRSVLEHDDITAEVEAVPTAVRVVSGDPDAGIRTCLGRGIEFDPSSTHSPDRQADAPGACVVRYTSASGAGPDGSERPPMWIGSVTVVWSARWRANDGDWRSLGAIPRVRLFQRESGTLSTAIESNRR